MRKTREFALAGFDAVEVASAIQAEIVQGERFEVTVAAAEEVLDQVHATLFGSTLRLEIRFQFTLNWLFQRQPIFAHVTLPDLRGLRAGGASHVEINPLALDHDLELEASGASAISGTVTRAGRVTAELSGASSLDLAGAVQAVDLVAAGASHARLDRLAAGEAQVEARGASTVQLGAANTLDYEVTGASTLKYAGHPTIGRAISQGASTVVPAR